MINPWEKISLSDYESHMSLDSVMQLQALNSIMKDQLEEYPVMTAMVLGIAGGNGLENVDVEKYRIVYGVDINEDYLRQTAERYASLGNTLQCIRVNLVEEYDKLPQSELLIANLLVEYIGYEVFSKVILKVRPEYVSCVIQINTGEKAWVSDSPYLHVFDGLDEVHHQMDADIMTDKMNRIGYKKNARSDIPLPNGKSLVRIDFQRQFPV